MKLDLQFFAEDPQSGGTATEEKDDSNQAYIDTIQKLKENTVSKDKYNKLLEDNKNLLETIVNGGSVEKKEEEPKMNQEEFLKLIKSTNDDLTDLEYTEKMLKIRQAIIDKGLEDPMAPKQYNHTNTEEDYATAQKVAEFLQSCVDESKGDSRLFKVLFQSGLKDPIIRKKK